MSRLIVAGLMTLHGASIFAAEWTEMTGVGHLTSVGADVASEVGLEEGRVWTEWAFMATC